jgi:2'-5' RNA ligase
MSTISLVLNDPAASQIRAMWDQLEGRFGLKGVRKVPFPHLTLLGFDGLTHHDVKDLLERLSQGTAPFTLETNGLALFADPSRILFSPVVRTPVLHRLQHVLYRNLRDLGGQVPRLYEPEHWVPHITLAQGDAGPSTYGEAVAYLLSLKADLNIAFEVRNLTLFDWIGPRYEPCDRFPLMGRLAQG